MDKETYLKKSKKDMAADLAKKIAKERERKKKNTFNYKIDKKKLAAQLKKFKASLGSALGEKINLKASQLQIKQRNKESKGK